MIAQLFIDGQWRDGSTAESFPVMDPATGDVIARFPAATSDDCLAAVAAAVGISPNSTTSCTTIFRTLPFTRRFTTAARCRGRMATVRLLIRRER